MSESMKGRREEMTNGKGSTGAGRIKSKGIKRRGNKETSGEKGERRAALKNQFGHAFPLPSFVPAAKLHCCKSENGSDSRY